MVEVRTIADGFLNYTKATAISLNGIRLLCYLGILCRVALTDHSTRKIPGRYHIYILLIAAADMVLTALVHSVRPPMIGSIFCMKRGSSCGRTDAGLIHSDSRGIWRRRYQIHGSFRISAWKRENHLFDGMCGYACRRILPYYVEMWKADQKG